MRRFVVAGVALGAVVVVGNHNNQTQTEAEAAMAIAAEASAGGDQPANQNQQPEQPSEPPAAAEQIDDGYRPVEVAEHQFVGLFRSCGHTHGVDPALLAAVAMVESSFRVYPEKSHAGAEGLMQFMPNTARNMGVDPYDPESAVCGAAKYLANSLRVHGSWDLAIAAYNAGDPQVSDRGVAAADGFYVEDVKAEWGKRTTGEVLV